MYSFRLLVANFEVLTWQLYERFVVHNLFTTYITIEFRLTVSGTWTPDGVDPADRRSPLKSVF